MTVYGLKESPTHVGFAGDNSLNLIATVFGSMPYNGHAYSMGVHAGHAGSSADARLGIYNLSGGAPGTLRGQSNNIDVNTEMTSEYNGQQYTVNLEQVATLNAGTGYALAVLFDDASARYGQGPTGWTMYRRSYSPSTFPSPMGYTVADTQTKLIIWVNYKINAAPNTPTGFLPTDGSTITASNPTYEADFSDPDEIMPNGLASDYLNTYQIQVRSVSAENATTGTVVWNSGSIAASSLEKSNKRFSKVHSGTALTQGQRYQWRCRMQDRFGTWSSWSHADNVAWVDFFVASGGVITLDGTPTGRVTDTTPDFQGRYHHLLGTSADRVQVQLYTTDVGGGNPQLYATSSEITKAVSSSAMPGTLFTITAGESGFGTLPSGVQWSYRIRARTTGTGVWSDYSDHRTFFTNARPNTPTDLTPTGGIPVTNYPLLTFRATDADNDSLTGSVRIKNSGGSVLFTRSATYDAALYSGQGGFKYQTNGTDLATYATYKWDCSTSDGDLTSATSAESTFIYAEGPSITITSPTEDEVITTDTQLYEWTTTDQQKKRIYIYRKSDDLLVHDSTLLVSTTQNYAQPADILQNNTDYYMIVETVNSAPLTGTSAVRNFRLEYVSPAAVEGFSVFPDVAEFDEVPSINRLVWTTVTIDSAVFEGYQIYGRNLGQSFDQAMHLAEIMNRDVGTWSDTMPQSGVERIYTIVYKVRESSIDILTSDPAEGTSLIELKGSVISDVRDGLHSRAVFESVQMREEAPQYEQSQVSTWGGGPPWLYLGPTYYRAIEMEAEIRNSDAVDVDNMLTVLRGEAFDDEPHTPPYGGLTGVREDGSVVLVCYRDERGLKIFGRMNNLKVSYQKLRRATVEFELTQTPYSEAVSNDT